MKAIIFDLDDTLYPEHTFVESGFLKVSQYAARYYGVDQNKFFELLLKILKKKGRGHVFDDALRFNNAYEEQRVEKLLKVYRTHKPNINLYAGVGTLLKSLKKRYKLTLLTDGMGAVQRNKVKALNIERFFDLLLYSDDYGIEKAKPNTFVFQKVLDFFKISNKNIIHIGDDPAKDFIGARNIGIKSVRVLQGRYKDLIAEDGFGADFTVGNILEVDKLLMKLE